MLHGARGGEEKVTVLLNSATFLTLFADGSHKCDVAAQEVHARFSGAAACHRGDESRGGLRPGFRSPRGCTAADRSQRAPQGESLAVFG